MQWTTSFYFELQCWRFGVEWCRTDLELIVILTIGPLGWCFERTEYRDEFPNLVARFADKPSP